MPKLETINSEKIMHYIEFDKKHENGKLNFILLEGLGRVKISQDVSMNDILNSLKVLNEN